VTKRKGLSKGKRFDIFRRDGFTCQYCGQQPPDVVLEVDHILPVVEGGDNDPMNLTTSCRPCNQGKGKKLLDHPPQRPDADLAWLEMQQDIAELRAYQEAKKERDALLRALVALLQDTWQELTAKDWVPKDAVLLRMLVQYSPGTVEDALRVVANRVSSGYLGRSGAWCPYMWGVLRNMAEGTEKPGA